MQESLILRSRSDVASLVASLVPVHGLLPTKVLDLSTAVTHVTISAHRLEGSIWKVCYFSQV